MENSEYNQTLLKNVQEMKTHMQSALQIALFLQKDIEAAEGDSDLHRKFAFYLSPNLNHWISGLQAGNMKDLEDTLNERINPKVEDKKKDKKKK